MGREKSGRKHKEFHFCDDVENFLKMKKESTRYTYRSGLAKFQKFYKDKYGKNVTVATFLDRVSEDLKQARRKQTRLAETEFNGFIQYLAKMGKSPNSIRAYVTAVQNLMKYYHISLSMAFVNVPKGITQKINHKHEWTLNHVKEFFGKATNYRDKAITLCMFQSGIAVNELCELNFGDVEKELETLPLCLRIVREKTGTEYKTFLGRDAVHYLKLYLETRSNLTKESPLFTKLGSAERVTTGGIQARFRIIAENCSFISEDDLKGFNPARPHSLRSAFRSRLTGKMDGDLIEYFMGHVLSGSKSPYIQIPIEELKELYANYEHLLSVEKTSKDEYSVATDKGKQFSELNVKIRSLEETITHLSTDLKAQRKLSQHFFKMTGIDPEILQKAYEESLKESDRWLRRKTEEEKQEILKKT